MSRLRQIKHNRVARLVIGGSALSVAAAGTAVAHDADQDIEERNEGQGSHAVDLEGKKVVVADSDVDLLDDRLDDETATPDSPDSPATPDSPDTPATPDSPATPESAASPESPVSPESPASPASPESPVTPDTPATPDTPDTPDTPATPESPATPDSPDDDE